MPELLQNIKYNKVNLKCNNSICGFNVNNECSDIEIYLDCEINSIDIDIYEDK